MTQPGKRLETLVKTGEPVHSDRMWTFSDEESDVSGPCTVSALSAVAQEPVDVVAQDDRVLEKPLPLLPVVADSSSSWAPVVRNLLREKGVRQSRKLRVESALSGTLAESAIFKATIVPE